MLCRPRPAGLPLEESALYFLGAPQDFLGAPQDFLGAPQAFLGAKKREVGAIHACLGGGDHCPALRSGLG